MRKAQARAQAALQALAQEAQVRSALIAFGAAK